MARRRMSLKVEQGYTHREHRSKKGRHKPIPMWGDNRIYKQKKQSLKLESLRYED